VQQALAQPSVKTFVNLPMPRCFSLISARTRITVILATFYHSVVPDSPAVLEIGVKRWKLTDKVLGRHPRDMMDQFTHGSSRRLVFASVGSMVCAQQRRMQARPNKRSARISGSFLSTETLYRHANRSPDSFGSRRSLLADVMIRLVGMSRAVGAPFEEAGFSMALDLTFSFFCFPLGIFFALF
jgi:hypothetical protein